jgi:hypothetical protein
VHGCVGIISFYRICDSVISKIWFAYSQVHRFVLVRSAIAGLRASRRSQALVVIGGVDVVPRMRVIPHFPCIPRLDRGRPR